MGYSRKRIKNETIVVSEVSLEIFRAKTKPGNICFSRLELRILGSESVRACAKNESFENEYRDESRQRVASRQRGQYRV